MRTGKGDAPGMGFPAARRRRRELYTAAAFGGQKMASYQRGLGVRTLRGSAFFDSANVPSAKFTVAPAEGVASELATLCPALLLQFESFWLPFLATSSGLFHFYLPFIFPTHQLHLPLHSALPSPLLFFSHQHLPLPLSTFSSPSPTNTCCISKSASLGAQGEQCPRRRLCSPI